MGSTQNIRQDTDHWKSVVFLLGLPEILQCLSKGGVIMLLAFPEDRFLCLYCLQQALLWYV